MLSGGSTLLHCVKCKGASDTDVRVRELTDTILANGMCFEPGVLNYPPTSWELCKCAETMRTGRCACPKTRTRPCYDMRMVPSESVIEALRDVEGSNGVCGIVSSARTGWTRADAARRLTRPLPDHAVTSGHLWLASVQPLP